MKALTLGSIQVQQAGTTDSNGENIASALARNLPELSPAICSHDGHFVIVASGPSLPQYVEAIREEQLSGRPICAINGAHDFLVENGITPHLFVSTDPRNTIVANVSKPQNDTIYLLASRCNPELFEHLKDSKVLIWHAWSDEPECKVWQDEKRFGIGGGTTSGLRAIQVAYVLGFRRFILYGFDSCLAKDKDTKRFSGEKVGPRGYITDVIVGGKRFWCNGALAQQATEFQMLYRYMPELTIEAKGDGLIAAIIAERKKRGFAA